MSEFDYSSNAKRPGTRGFGMADGNLKVEEVELDAEAKPVASTEDVADEAEQNLAELWEDGDDDLVGPGGFEQPMSFAGSTIDGKKSK